MNYEQSFIRQVPDIDSECTAAKELNEWYRKLSETYDDPEMDIPLRRIFFEHWGDFGREPKDVDYFDTEINGVKCLVSVPHNCQEDRVLLCFHGGGYIYGNRFTHRKGYTHLAKAIGCKAVLVDYRTTPEHAWPAPINDAVCVYQALLDSGIKPQHVVFTGDSCGGALNFSVVLTLKEKGIPLPAAVMPISPWIDCMASTSLYDTNDRDVLNSKESIISFGMNLKEAGVDVLDPHVAPMYLTREQMHGFPPIYITVGGNENMVEEAVIVSETAYAAGADVRLDVVEGMQHSFIQLAGACSNTEEQIRRFAEWVKPLLGL